MTQPSGHAQQLCDDRLLNEIFDKLEAKAVEAAISAPSSDDEMRLTSVLKVKAIRSVRAELQSLAKGKTNRSTTDAVA